MAKKIQQLEDLLPDPHNANAGTERGMYMIETSLEKLGAGRSIVVDRDGRVIAGNKTLQAALEKGFGVQVVRTDGKQLVVVQREDLVLDADDGKARQLAYADNRAGQVGLAWDAEQILADLRADVDLENWFKQDELDAMLAGLRVEEPAEDAGAQIDRATELQQEWQTERGQVWEVPSKSVPGKSHRVMCGDSTRAEDVERLMGGEKFKYGLHDPPYGISVVNSTSSAIGGSKGFGTVGAPGKVPVNRYAPIIGDNAPFDPQHILGITDYCVLWGANYFSDKLPPMKGWIVWDKKGRADWNDNFSDCELAWTNMPIVTSIVYHTHMGMVQEGNRERRVHPTQKPAGMLVKVISEHFKEDGAVLDLYLGSGSTLAACEQTARVGYGMEIEPAYVAVTLQRLKDMGLEPRLLDNS